MMPSPHKVTPKMREAIILAWHSEDTAAVIGADFQVDSRTIYNIWNRAKSIGLLPDRDRTLGVFHHGIRDGYHNHEIRIGDRDRLLERLRTHHHPGHGELAVASAPIIARPSPW